ncbi:Dynactin subunit 1 [Rhizoctonia solani]|uniref:Dynactin subunit 1 n=1 Tax=Rhizoctonia solani TaxID=456999 RepID=A0A0K6FXV4_9AGAM|nr:Dynactin subunit 1 [Rhizoctonia solani]
MPKFTAAASRAHIPSSFLDIGVVASSEPGTPTSNGLVRRVSAYSQVTSSPCSQPETLGRSKRKVVPTKRALAGHIPEVAKSKQRSRAYRRTLELKKVGLSSRGRKLEHTARTQSHLDEDQTDSEPEISTGDRTTKPPTSISTPAEGKAQQISNCPQIESQIFRKFRHILQDTDTQGLEGVLEDLSNDSTHPVRAEESDPEVQVLSPIPVAIGGGFHLDYHSTNLKEMNVQVSSLLINQQRLAHRMPNRPLADPASPFIARTEVSNPPQSPRVTRDHMSDGGQTEIEEAQVEDQQPGETLGILPLRQPNVHTSPLITATSLSTRPAGHRSGPHRTRLNIVEINSARELTQTRRTTVGSTCSSQGSRHVNPTSQRHFPQPNPTPNPTGAPHSLSQHRLLRSQSAQAPSLSFEPPPALQAQSDTDLLEDDEEERAILRAMSTCTIAHRKKRKPAMSDLDAEERHIVLIVRDLVLARSLQEGTFQTRGVYRRWFEESYAQVYSLVHNGELIPASDDMCTVTINNMSTSRGHINDRERELVRRYYNFVDPTNDEQCQENVNSYAILWPTAFICKDPSSETGHFESDVIGAGIAAGYFHAPTAVGVKYPKYFKLMEDPLVAFTLCSVQCCIGEWGEGYFEKKPFSARYMLSLYICHLKGLKEANVAAPGRMAELRAKWYNDSLKASGALRTPKSKKFVQRTIRREDIRPDSPHRRPRPIPRNATPGPGPTSELNRNLRYSPLRARSSATPLARSRLQTPLSPRAEESFDTSRTKGKGRAN